MSVIRPHQGNVCYFFFFLYYILSIFYTQLSAQVYSDDQLFEKGSSYYNQNDFLNAAVYLFAYIQRTPQLIANNSDFATQVRTAFNYSLQQSSRTSSTPQTQTPQTQTPQTQTRRTKGNVEIPELKLKELKVKLSIPPPLTKPQYNTSQPNSTIVCRGGGNLYFNYTPFSNLFNQPQIWITFERGSDSLGKYWEYRQRLHPGQAAFLDRGIFNNEPNQLIIPLGRNDFSISWTQGKVMGVSSSLTYLSILQDSNKFQAFQAYNDGNGNFIVIGIGQQME